MNYIVLWTGPAEDELTEIWLAADDRGSVTQAAYRLDLELKTNPLLLGESRSSALTRIAFEAPLRIEFEVIEDDKRVRVLGVWRAH